MREYFAVPHRRSDPDHVAPRFQSPSLARRAWALSPGAPLLSLRSERLAAARKGAGLTSEQTRLWAKIVRFVFVLCACAGLVVGVHLGAAGGF